MTLRKWCRANWNKLPEDVRKKCVDHLDAWLKESKHYEKNLAYLRDYDKHVGFHFFSGGVSIRNCLRRVLTDGELPVVTVDHEGKPYGPSQNWDDYYTGALDEFLERYPNGA